MLKRIIPFVIIAALILCPITAYAEDSVGLDLTAKSAILVEKTSGEVLYEYNADEVLPPASVTKIMTLLLVFEEMEKGTMDYDTTITVSAYAASMGGSQAYLEEGEQMSLDDMLKAVFVSSCNDAAVALGEHVSGSIGVFVSRMNERAQELGMTNTHFENCTGLDDVNMTTARDIAIMSAALIKYPKVREYATIWMDNIRGGQFGLSNTNKLVKRYNGITGLKTGFTTPAGHCISATAERDGMELIAVVLGAPSSEDRFTDASKLLDYGFANYSLLSYELPKIADMRVTRGKDRLVPAEAEDNTVTKLVKKGTQGEIEARIDMPGSVSAPIMAGDKLGTVQYFMDGEIIGESNIVASLDVKERSIFGWLASFWSIILGRVS